MSAIPTDEATPFLARYGLGCPNEQDALAALTRVVGASRGRLLWERACEAVGLEAGTPKSLAQLKRVAAYMATLPGPEGVMGASLSLRIGTYEVIAAAAGAGTSSSGEAE